MIHRSLANGELMGRAAMRSKRKISMRRPTPQESRRRKRGSRRCVGSTDILGPAKSLTRFWRGKELVDGQICWNTPAALAHVVGPAAPDSTFLCGCADAKSSYAKRCSPDVA